MAETRPPGRAGAISRRTITASPYAPAMAKRWRIISPMMRARRVYLRLPSWLFQPHYRPLGLPITPPRSSALPAILRLTDLLASIRPLDASYAAAINGWRYASDAASE